MVKHVLFFYYDSLAKHVLEGSTVMLQQKYLKLFSDKKKEKVPNNCREGNPTLKNNKKGFAKFFFCKKDRNYFAKKI